MTQTIICTYGKNTKHHMYARAYAKHSWTIAWSSHRLALKTVDLYPLHPITLWKKMANQISKGELDSGKGGPMRPCRPCWQDAWQDAWQECCWQDAAGRSLLAGCRQPDAVGRTLLADTAGRHCWHASCCFFALGASVLDIPFNFLISDMSTVSFG